MAYYEKMNVFCKADKNRDIKIMTWYKTFISWQKGHCEHMREKMGWGMETLVEDYFPLSRPVSKPVKLCAFMRTNKKTF